jgi:hypothetical protein
MLKSCENKQLRDFILNFYDTILKTGDIPGKMSEAKIIPLVKDKKKDMTILTTIAQSPLYQFSQRFLIS